MSAIQNVGSKSSMFLHIPPPPYEEHLPNPAKGLGNIAAIESNTGVVAQTSKNENFYRAFWIVLMIAVFIFSGVFLFKTLFPYPLQASCTIRWSFGQPCDKVIAVFINQLSEWSKCHKCEPNGSNCLYQILSINNHTIYATHKTISTQITEHIRLEFDQAIPKSCIVTGESQTSDWFVVFDQGGNYCNLYNLAKAALPIVELTSNSLCTQYKTAIC